MMVWVLRKAHSKLKESHEDDVFGKRASRCSITARLGRILSLGWKGMICLTLKHVLCVAYISHVDATLVPWGLILITTNFLCE